MNTAVSIGDSHISLLARLVIQGYEGGFSNPAQDLQHLEAEVDTIAALSQDNFLELLKLADMHHVTVRALRVLQQLAVQKKKTRVSDWCETALKSEKARIWKAVEWLYAIVQALELNGCPVCVIKSLDHWPDLGSDLDLYTSGKPENVIRVMQEKVRAQLEPRSWGDRLANKWNFQIPGLNELVEIHIRYLGQTGEQKLMAARVLERATTKTISGRTFRVPAPEERILISTLQRMYRHFYFRLCDIADIASFAESLDFSELRRGAETGGVWPGVASFLLIVSRYVEQYGRSLPLPDEVVEAASSPNLSVQFRGNFLRVPMKPAAGLYGSQLLSAGRHGDLRAISRLPLLPPLAVSALVAFRLTGSDKGVW